MPQATPNVGANSLSYETSLPEPAAKTARETVPSRVEPILVVHTVNMATKDVDGTAVESDSDATEHKLQPPSKSVPKLSLDTRRGIKRVLADLNVVKRIDVEAIVENRLKKKMSTLQLHIVKILESVLSRTH